MAKKPESRVNEAGVYTKPGMRKSLFERLKAGDKGGRPGQLSSVVCHIARMARSAVTKASG